MAKKNKLSSVAFHSSHLKSQIRTLESGGKLMATDFEKLGLPPFEQNDRPTPYTIELQLETPRDVYCFLERLPEEHREDMSTIITKSLEVEKSVVSKWYPPLGDTFSSSNSNYWWGIR